MLRSASSASPSSGRRNPASLHPLTTVPAPTAVPRRRLLSLDFDGVLHPGPQVTTKLAHFCWLPSLCSLLTQDDDVDVLVHSTWRHEFTDQELKDLLGPLGPRCVGAVPRSSARYDGILWWLVQNKAYVDYRILDDDLSEYPEPPPPELIWCPPDTGITAPEVRQALALWLAREKRSGES